MIRDGIVSKNEGRSGPLRVAGGGGARPIIEEWLGAAVGQPRSDGAQADEPPHAPNPAGVPNPPTKGISPSTHLSEADKIEAGTITPDLNANDLFRGCEARGESPEQVIPFAIRTPEHYDNWVNHKLIEQKYGLPGPDVYPEAIPNADGGQIHIGRIADGAFCDPKWSGYKRAIVDERELAGELPRKGRDLEEWVKGEIRVEDYEKQTAELAKQFGIPYSSGTPKKVDWGGMEAPFPCSGPMDDRLGEAMANWSKSHCGNSGTPKSGGRGEMGPEESGEPYQVTGEIDLRSAYRKIEAEMRSYHENLSGGPVEGWLL